MTDTSVSDELSEITTDHKLISQDEGNYEGIKTSTFQYQIDEAVTEDYELNGLKRISLIELSVSDFTAQTIGSVSSSAPTSGLYLGTQRIDNGGSIKTRESVWLEAGTLSVSTKNLAEGVLEVTTVFLVTEGTTVGPVTSRSTSNFEGLKTISVDTLQDKNGNSLIGEGSNLVHRYEKKVDFTYPGVVGIRQDEIDSNVGIDPILMNFNLDPPVQAKVTGTVSVIFQNSSTITAADEIYDDGTGAADGYWNPTQWAKTYVSGIGWNYSAFVESQGLRGYRVNTDVSGIKEIAPTTTNKAFASNGVVVFRYGGTTAAIEASSSTTSGSLYARVVGLSDASGEKFTVSGKRLYGSTPFLLEATGGPDDPSGNHYVLDIDIRPAFEDINGNIYFKKTIVTATV
jgi:hypothetical protein